MVWNDVCVVGGCSGNPTPRRKLLTALQQNGDVTSDQLSAWLRNRSTKTGGINKVDARRPAGCAPHTGLCCRGEAHEPNILQIKTRRRKNDREKGDWKKSLSVELAPFLTLSQQEMQHYGEIVDAVVAEISSVMTGIDGREMQSLCRTLRNARYVICHGVGVEGLALQAFAHSLNELGMDAFCLTDVSMPQIAEDDVFLVSAGPSFYSTVSFFHISCITPVAVSLFSQISALALEAKRLGTPVIAFTAHPAADMLFAQDIIRIPSQTLTPSMPIVSKKRMTPSGNVIGACAIANSVWSYRNGVLLARRSGERHESSCLIRFQSQACARKRGHDASRVTSETMT